MTNATKNIQPFVYTVATVLALIMVCQNAEAASTKTPTPVTSCGTVINLPGDYILNGNIDCAGTIYGGIYITVKGVDLDLNGYTLSNAQSGKGAAVLTTSNVQGSCFEPGMLIVSHLRPFKLACPRRAYIFITGP